MPGFGDWVARLLSGAGRAGEEAAAAPPFTARVYRGAPGPEQWPPTSQANDTFWASDSPAVADTYAANFGDLSGTDLPARVTPAEVRFQNPLVIDAGGREWDNIPFDGKRYTSDAFASLARRRGYDGLVLRNVQDDGPLATSYAAVKPGTVFSPLTGERLYAGAPIAAGAGATAALAGSPSRSEAATPDKSQGFGDQIARMMLNQQPAVSGPLPQQASPQQQPSEFDQHMDRIKQFWAGDGEPAPQSQQPPGQPSEFDQHMQNIADFWERNRNAVPQRPAAPQPQQMTPGQAVLRLIRGAAVTEPNKLAGALYDVVQPAKRLFIDGGWQRGPDDPQAAADMRNILLSSGLGTSVAPVAPRDALGVFAGIKGAENMAEAGLRSPNALGGANRLRWARMREASGMAPEDIWDRHGWFRDADGKWKMEISDDPLRVNMDSIQSGGLNNPEGEIYHPLVAAAYPETSNKLATWVERSPTVDGSEARRGKRGLSLSVFAPDEDKARSVAAHEINHLIASREGFDTGLPSTHPDYWFSTGEAAARNVQNRLGMSRLDRRFTSPGETSDIPRDMQVRAPDSGEEFLGNIDADLRTKILAAADKGMAPSAIAGELKISPTLAGAVISAGKKAAPQPKYLGGGAPGDWSGAMEATLDDLTAKGELTAQQMADAINEKHGLSLTANAVRQKISQAREEKTPVRARWPEPAKVWLQSPEAFGLSHREAADALNEKFGLETTPATVQNARARLKKVSQ